MMVYKSVTFHLKSVNIEATLSKGSVKHFSGQQKYVCMQVAAAVQYPNDKLPDCYPENTFSKKEKDSIKYLFTIKLINIMN